MVNISKIDNIRYNHTLVPHKKSNGICGNSVSCDNIPNRIKSYDSNHLKSYHPSFTAKTGELPSEKKQLSTVKSKLDKDTQAKLNNLLAQGILSNKDSNDGSTVLENLYKIATKPRIRGLRDTQILTDVINALNNPYSITQKFGDIPVEVAAEIEKETGKKFPEQAYNVVSSSCVVASMEYNLASKKPAEFARFAEGLSGENYSVEKKIKMSDFSVGIADALWKLREFNTENKIGPNWEDVIIKIKPDRNAIVRARVQSSYRDPGERSVVDVLIQSALLNLASQNTYDALSDERTGKFNSDKTGLTDMEKTFAEQIVFESPMISVTYQNIDENGFLVGYNCEPQETKNHILKALELGKNVIVGYTHIEANNKINGGHEITITKYETDQNGNGYFICNDTDDGEDIPVRISETKLLPLIHHAGIPKEALSKDDVIVEPWREILTLFQNDIK